MRTTVDISDHLLVQAKKLAAEEHMSMRAVIEEALRLVLAQRRGGKSFKIKDFELLACDAGKPLPGVDLNDTSKLLEIE